MSTTVWITTNTIAACEGEANSASPDETGGVLLGWHNVERNEIVVVHALGPGPHSTHARYSYNPDGDWHDRTVDAVYQRSGRIVTYVGDWHTHPRGRPTLSRTDIHTLRRIAHNDEARCPFPLMLILANTDDDPRWIQQAHLWNPRRIVLWELGATTPLPLRTWEPADDEFDGLGLPFL